jgi:hypothetical protein
MSRSRDIIFLVGAGASAEASIPTSAAMIDRIETSLKNDKEWRGFNDLYNHVRSAIHYSAGLKGCFGNSVLYNIETLVNTLYELERNEEHPLYPFIAAWNSRFVSLASEKFTKVQEFRLRILTILKEWMCPADPSEGDYYKGFIAAQKSLNFPLHIFSLNYDRCVERLTNNEFVVETGFSGFGPKHVWSWERFIESERGSNPLPQAFLYKLHGSIDWIRDENSKELSCVEQVQRIKPEQMEIIFGREFKLEAADPYLFYAYEFRQFAFDSRLIVVIGYGFADAHINKMLTQALRSDGPRKLVAVVKASDDDIANRRVAIARQLDVSEDRIAMLPGTAKSFLSSPDIGECLMSMVPEADGSPF